MIFFLSLFKRFKHIFNVNIPRLLPSFILNKFKYAYPLLAGGSIFGGLVWNEAVSDSEGLKRYSAQKK